VTRGAPRLRGARAALARVALALAVLCAVAWPAPAPARPGGGQTYKGSSSSGSRSSGSSTSRSSSGSSRSSSGSSFSSGSRSSGSSTSGSSRSSSGSSFSSGSTTSSSDSWSRRPSYSLPSSSGSSSSGGESSGDVGGSFGQFFFFILVFGAVLVIVLVMLWNRRNGWRGDGWTTSAESLQRTMAEAERELEAQRGGGPPSSRGPAGGAERPLRPAEVVAKLRKVGAHDEDFSYALFEDFAYALYAETHYARGGGRIERVTPYLGDKARWALMVALGTPREVRNVVIGAMRVEAVRRPKGHPDRVAVVVRFEANYVEVSEKGDETAYYADERWTFERDQGAKSRAPEAARVVGCPNCGAPLDKIVGGTCKSCGAAGWSGEREWFVTKAVSLTREPRSPAAAGDAEEVGTDLPTVVDPDARARFDDLKAKDPGFAWPAFVARIETVFGAFHASWSARDLAKVRPYLSDNLFEAQRYWVDAYKRSGLRNVTEGARVVSVHMARISSDKHYDAVTVRVFATCLDYTLDEGGNLVAGSREKPREYSEYWTFLRGAGAKGAPRADAACPNCGAPLDVGMAGQCTYCKAKVTGGEFDWVLSRIEQDEAYSLRAPRRPPGGANSLRARRRLPGSADSLRAPRRSPGGAYPSRGPRRPPNGGAGRRAQARLTARAEAAASVAPRPSGGVAGAGGVSTRASSQASKGGRASAPRRSKRARSSTPAARAMATSSASSAGSR
jgi:predicted lipid-binding transport protein (Tim44 family)